MSPSEIIALAAGGLMTIVTGVVLFVLKGYITDLKNYRAEREQKEREHEIKEDAKDDLVLGLARCSLIENYYKCERQGYYSTTDREVYGKLFKAYVTCGGDGVIDQLAPKLQQLPTSLPTN